MEELSFQDEIPNNHCWGCGNPNEHGLQIKSYWSGEEAVCTWHPKAYHGAGPKNILNGGIIATIIDCHCMCTAIAAAYRAEGRRLNTNPPTWYATAVLKVSYLRPTPVDKPITLRAKVREMNPKKTLLECSLYAEDEERARAEVVAVRVPPEWREGDMM